MNDFLHRFENELIPGDLVDEVLALLATEIIAAPPGGVATTVRDYFVQTMSRGAMIRAAIYERLPVQYVPIRVPGAINYDVFESDGKYQMLVDEPVASGRKYINVCFRDYQTGNID